MLTHHDAELGHFLNQANPDPSPCVPAPLQRLHVFVQHAWGWLSTLMSEVLSRQEWLKLWDHCFTAGPSFLYHVVVACLMFCRCTAVLRSFRRSGKRWDWNLL